MMLLALSVLGGCGKKDKGDDVAKTDVPKSAESTTPSATDAGTDTQPSVEPAGDAGSTLTVIASPGIHTQILNQAKDILAGEGITLVIDSEFDDYMMPNWFVDGSVYDCNYYQHEVYMNTFNEEQDTDLVSVGKIHFEPLGLYPGTKVSLSSLANGDTIAIPRDTANQARALSLLSDAGIITMPSDKRLDGTIKDVAANPYNIKFELMDASQIPSAVARAAFVVMNGNYARQALYTVTTDALFFEQANTEVADKYANIIAVRRDRQDDPLVKKLVEVLQGDEIRTYIENSFAGAVVPYTGS